MPSPPMEKAFSLGFLVWLAQICRQWLLEIGIAVGPELFYYIARCLWGPSLGAVCL